MTFTAAIVTGLGFFTGVLIGWALVFTALLIAFGIYSFFTRKNTEDDWPEHATPDNVPEYDLSEWDIPAFLRRNKEPEQLNLPL